MFDHEQRIAPDLQYTSVDARKKGIVLMGLKSKEFGLVFDLKSGWEFALLEIISVYTRDPPFSKLRPSTFPVTIRPPNIE